MKNVYQARWTLLGLAFCLVVPSTGEVQKYLGTPAVVLYAALVLATVFWGYGKLLPWFLNIVNQRRATLLAVATGLVVVAIFAVLHPIAESGSVGGGSDSDDAINLGVAELLQGRYPYYPKTYIGNPILPMPGALLLATPFVLLGDCAYQNIFWLLAAFVAIRIYLNDARWALLFLWSFLALSPAVFQQIASGSDKSSNAIYVLLFTVFVLTSASRTQGGSNAKLLAASALLGLGLSARPNYLLILPLIFSALVRQLGLSRALQCLGVTVAVILLVTVPFYAYDPQAFTPLLSYKKVSQFERVLPYAGILITGGTGLIALLLSWTRTNHDLADVLRNCAIVQAVPPLAVLVLTWIAAGWPWMLMSGYAFSFAFFGALAAFVVLAARCNFDSQRAADC